MNIDTLRKKYPGYSDDEILTGLQATQYPDYSVEEIKQAIGYKPRTRNVAAVANDLVIEAANAAAGGVSSAASFVSPGNRFSQFIDENIVRSGEEKQSDFAKDAKGRMREGIDKAQGVGDELAAVGGYVADAPGLATAQAVGSFVGPGAAIKGSSLLAQAAGAGARGTARAGMAGGSVAGGAMAGGDAAQTAYELVLKSGGTEEQAQAAAREASVIPAAVGAAGGVIGAERLFAGAAGPAGGVLRRAAVTGGTEALQEGVEEGITQFEGQRAAAKVDPTIDPTKGVAAAAGLGAVLGGVTGAGVSLITRDAQRADATQRLAEAKTLDDAIAAANDLAMPPSGLLDQARGFSADREAQALGGMEAQADADLKGIRQAGRMDPTGLPPQPPQPERKGSAEFIDSPLADRILTVRDQLADPQVREQIRALQPELLREAAYYVNQADNATGIPEATRDRMLAVAESIIQRATLRQMQDPQALGSREFGAPEQIGGAAAPAQIGLDTAPTGTVRVDSAGNAAPETRADSISTAQRVAEMRQRNQGGRGMAEQAERDKVRGAGPGVMVGDGTLTTPQRPARPARAVPLLENGEGREQSDLPVPSELAPAAAAGGGDFTAGSRGTVGREPADGAGRVPDTAEASASRRGAPEPVGEGRQPDETLSDLQAQWRDAANRGDSMAAKAINDRIVEMKARTLKRPPADADPKIAGKKLDDEWTAFTPESGTKDIPRAEMPQIKAEHRGAMTQFLKGRGITHEQAEVPADSLKPTQREFSPGKVAQARQFVGEDRAILVSSDGFVLDGHHQWLAKREADAPIRVIRFDAPIAKLVDEAKQFPSAEQSEGAAAPGNRSAWERSVAEPLGLQLGGAGWNLPVGNLGEVVVSFTSKPGEPLRAEVSAEYFGKSFDKRTAEGEPAIKEAIERARAGIQEGRERMAREGVAGDKPPLRERVERTRKPKGEVTPATGRSVMPEGLFVTFGGKTFKVDSIEDAQRKWVQFQETAGAGVSEVGNGVEVVDGAGRKVGRISFNGRAWDAADNLIAEAPAPQPAADAETAVAPVVEARKSLADARRDAALDREVSDSGERMTRRQWVERKVSEGLKPSIKQEDKIKPMSRMQFFRANNEEQRAHERRIKEAGKKDVYWIGGYEVTKIEHDYAVSLLQQPEAKPPLAERVERPRKKAAEPVAAVPAEATHKDPGEATEPATPAVVKEAIQTAARNDGRPIKDVKAEALRLIDEAMAGAKDENDPDVLMYAERSRVKVDKKALDRRGLIGRQRELAEADIQRKIDAERNKAADNIGYVTISVPGDGTFKVLNTKERLTEFRKKVEASPGFKAQRPGPTAPERVNGNAPGSVMNKTAGSRFGVESGSGSTKAAIEAMIDDGDPQAAVDYAATRGLNIADVLKGDKDRLKKTEGLEPTPEADEAPAAPSPAAEKPKAERPAAKGPATAQAAIDAFNADDSAQAMAIVAKLKLDDLKTVGGAIGYPVNFTETATAYRQRLAGVADRLTKTSREQVARERVLFDKLTNRASDFDRMKEHMERAERLGNAPDSTAFDTAYYPMDGGDSKWMKIPEALKLLAADVRSLKENPDYPKVSEMVRKARPAVFDAADAAPAAAPQPQPEKAEKQAQEKTPDLAPMPAVTGIPRDVAQRAHEGTSFTPEVRAGQEQESFMSALRDAWSRAAKIAGTDAAAIDRITEVFKDVADGYRQRYLATLGARSRVMSSMIAGPARFPVERNRKRLETERKRAEEASEYLQRGIKRLTRAARGPIDNSPESELERVRLNLSQREEQQEMMKAANVALRKGDDAALEDLGFTAEQIADLKKPDFAGRNGFPDYKLTNNNAEIRRLRERLKNAESRMEAAAAGPAEREVAGVRVVEDATADRLRLYFDDKPDLDVRVALKANGFRWSPKEGAWQRQLTGNARAAADAVLKKVTPESGAAEQLSIADEPGARDTAPDGQASPRHQQLAAEYQQRLQGRFPGTVFDAVPAGPAAGSGPDGDGVSGTRSRERAAVATVARRLFGQEVVFVRFPEGSKPLFNGAMSDEMPGVVFINADARRPMMAVLGHELVHQMSANQKALYQVLARRLNTVLKNEQQYIDLLDLKYTPEQRKGLKYGEELHADVVGDFFTDPQFWQDMAAEQPSLFKRVAQAIIRFLDNAIAKITEIRPFGTEQYITDLNAARAAVVDAMRQFSGTQVGAMTSQSDGINLSPGQRDVTSSPEFKRWFGDSKVVDAEGKPLVVYHATAKDFTTFKPGGMNPTLSGAAIWMTPNAQEQPAAHNIRAVPGESNRVYGARSGKFTPGTNVMPLYARVRNPLVSTDANWKQVYAGTEGGSPWILYPEAVAKIKAMGHDGALHYDKNGALAEVIAFDADQVKSAIGNRGTFDPASSDINLSIADEAPGATARTAQDLIDAKGGVFDFNRMGKTGQDRVRTVMDGSRPFWLGALTRDQIADIYGKEIPPVQDYDTLTRTMENERQKMAQDADDLYSDWSKIDAQANARLARVMLDATVHQVHPDGEFTEIKGADNAERRQVHARIAVEFKLLPKDAQAMYGRVKSFHENTLAKLREAIEGRIERQVENGKARAAALLNIRKMFDQYMENGPYFPLSRFGDFLVIATRGDAERVVATYATAGEQQAAARRLQSEGFTVKLKTSKTYSREMDGSAGKFIGDVLATVGNLDFNEATVGAKATDLKSQMLDDLNQMFIRALPDLSYRKHFLHRKNTPGFSSDVMRGFASAAFHSASHIARLNHGDKMTFALQDAYQQIENAPEGDFNLHSQVLNELSKRHDAMLNPNTHPIASMLNSVGFVMYLGMSPAAGLVNMLQTVMVTMPHLGARYGFGKANASLAGALKDITAAKANAKNGWNAAQSPKLSAAERAMMTELQDEGVIDLTQAHDLAAATGIDSGNVARSKAAFAMSRAMKIVGWTFHIPEVMNRQVTALSSYRLEMERSGDETKAKDAAREAIKRTHFDYSASNRARYMQGNLARVVTQFKQYSQNMTYLLGRAAHQALLAEDPEVRSIARRQLVATMGVTFGMAGALGLPGIGSVAGLIGMMVGAMDDDDKPWDWKVEMRNALADAFGQEVGEVIAHGIPRALMPWDIAGRVGMGELWWRSNDREGQNPREAFANDMQNILGPTAGSVLGFYTAADHMARGNWSKAAESVVPKFLRDPLKAMREGQDGVTTYTGEPLMDLEPSEIVGRLLGFAPARTSEMFEARNAVKNAETAITEKRQVLLSTMVKARIDRDMETVREIQADIAEFNRRNPAFRITSESISRGVMTKMRNRANTRDGIMVPRTRAELRDIGRFATTE